MCVGITLNDMDISCGQRARNKFPVNSKISITVSLTNVHCKYTLSVSVVTSPVMFPRSISTD